MDYLPAIGAAVRSTLNTEVQGEVVGHTLLHDGEVAHPMLVVRHQSFYLPGQSSGINVSVSVWSIDSTEVIENHPVTGFLSTQSTAFMRKQARDDQYGRDL